jgi:surfeit locus 1 family protein
MTEGEPRPPRSIATLAVLLAFAVLAGAGFFALGVWQVHRLAWKEALIARVDRQLRAEPVAPPPPAQWPALAREADEYRRVRVQGRFDFQREVLTRASTVLGPGFWVLTPMRTGDGWILVNRGFVPYAMHTQVPHGPEQQSLVGLLRFSEPGGAFLQPNRPAEGRWTSRDVAAIAAAEHLQGPVAPFFVDAQATPATGDATWPRPGLTVVHFRNEHLAYALTWFALAAMVAAAIGYLVVHERRLRRAGRPHAPDDRHR